MQRSLIFENSLFVFAFLGYEVMAGDLSFVVCHGAVVCTAVYAYMFSDTKAICRSISES